MKKLLFTLVLALAALSVSAQNHFEYKGIPIDGKFVTMHGQLRRNGWVRDNNAAKLEADAWAYKNTENENAGTLYIQRAAQSGVTACVSIYDASCTDKSAAEQIMKARANEVRCEYADAKESVAENGEIKFEMANGSVVCSVICFEDGTFAAKTQYIDKENYQIFVDELGSK